MSLLRVKIALPTEIDFRLYDILEIVWSAWKSKGTLCGVHFLHSPSSVACLFALTLRHFAHAIKTAQLLELRATRVQRWAQP